jgi:hypothetical protein
LAAVAAAALAVALLAAALLNYCDKLCCSSLAVPVAVTFGLPLALGKFESSRAFVAPAATAAAVGLALAAMALQPLVPD